jgi:hypothetical protein
MTSRVLLLLLCGAASCQAGRTVQRDSNGVLPGASLEVPLPHNLASYRDDVLISGATVRLPRVQAARKLHQGKFCTSFCSMRLWGRLSVTYHSKSEN